jgi:C4-dicarboxylate transporter, DctQ subunit
MHAIFQWLRARAEDVAALLLGAMFLAFMLQIIARYVLNIPVIWTQELCLTLWLWAVFWCCAFTLREGDHVKFDVLYQMCGRNVQRLMAALSAGAISLGFLVALPATIDYITFYKIKSSATMSIRLDLVFSVYGMFAIAMVITYGIRTYKLIMGTHPDDLVEDHRS